MAPKNPIENEDVSDSEEEKIVSEPPIEAEEEKQDVYSECSSPSDSGFIVCPIPKASDNKPKVNKIFSEDDEIALLKGFTQFRSEHGKENDWVNFHSFMKGKLSNEFTKTQVSEKIRSLKRKFVNNSAKGDRVQFQSPHEASLFQISKTLWENEAGGEKRKRVVNQEKKPLPPPPPPPPLKKHKQQNLEITKKEFEASFPLLCDSFNEVVPCWVGREKCYLIGREKGQELEDQFRKLKAEEISLRIKRYNLTLKELAKKSS